MEITMTLTVTPEQAMKIAKTLAGNTPQPAQNNLVPPQQVSNNVPTGNVTQVPPNTPTPQIIPQPASIIPTTAALPVSNPAMQAIPTQQIPPMQQNIPTQVQTYTVQDLALACRPLMEAGKQQELQALLAEFGASAGINSIPENRRADFAARLRAMGGQI